MERFVRERVRRPGGLEFFVAAVFAIEAAEVDAIKVTERLAGFGREVGAVGRVPGRVELDTARLAVCVDEPGQEAGTAHADGTAGEVARHGGEPILLADAVFMSREADRCQSAHY